MRHVVADTETDGLLDQLTRVHSLVVRDVETGAVLMSCAADQPGFRPITDGLRLLSEADAVYGHNVIRFDYPALRKVYPGWDMDREKLRDTLVVAQMRWAHIAATDHAKARRGEFPAHLAGSHALKAWGVRLGVLKDVFAAADAERWQTWTPEMQQYCEQDTAVARALVLHIRAHAPPVQAVETEHRLAWYLAQQERNGWPFDVEGAIALQARLAARREELGRMLTERGGWWYTSGGETTPRRSQRTRGGERVAGAAYSKLRRVEFNPSSRDHIARYLMKTYGWKPERYTPGGKPIVDDETLEVLDSASAPEIGLLREYFLVEKRLGQVAEGPQAWLQKQTATGPEGGWVTGMPHIHGRVKQNGTITHRAAHVDPNVAQVPSARSPYGAECRALWRVPPGWTLVGVDLSGLEARCLGHYMAAYDDGAYARLLLDGDVHTATRIALGLPEGTEYRYGAKTWYYAFLYGAGDAKLGRILAPLCGKTAGSVEDYIRLGRSRRKEFLANTPALGQLLSAVKYRAKERGYLVALDGRRVYTRSEHSALNTLLQSAGAIIAKRWVVDIATGLSAAYGPQGWRGQWAGLAWVHDEINVAARPEIAASVGQHAVAACRNLQNYFDLRVPLDAEAKLGATWRDVH